MTNEEAIKIMEIQTPRRGTKEKIQAHLMAVEALKAQRVGKWNIQNSRIDGRELFECPFCSCVFHLPVYERKHCPNCGAKMEGINE